jgi:hypothetical protein
MTSTTRPGRIKVPTIAQTPRPATARIARRSRTASPGELARREHEHDHELRQEQAGLGDDQAGRVVPAVLLVEQSSREEYVGVGEREEREQRVRAVHGLPQYFIDMLAGRTMRAAQEELTQQSRYGGAERETGHRPVD